LIITIDSPEISDTSFLVVSLLGSTLSIGLGVIFGICNNVRRSRWDDTSLFRSSVFIFRPGYPVILKFSWFYSVVYLNCRDNSQISQLPLLPHSFKAVNYSTFHSISVYVFQETDCLFKQNVNKYGMQKLHKFGRAPILGKQVWYAKTSEIWPCPHFRECSFF